MKYLLLIVLAVAIVQCVPTKDQVDFPIPGYTHKWYSGYLNFSTGSFHYVFFDSQKDPDNDPVVLWLNGGPGCSSLLGMVYQNGPFVFIENTTTFQINAFAWNLKANLLYIESPGGVGFSVDKRNLTNDDGTVAVDNYKALEAFFEKFPNLRKNDLYLSGQSYAGIYVPYLAKYIIDKNKLPETQMKMNLKGVLIGNACTDPRQCFEPGNDIDLGIYQYEFLYNHLYITEKDHDNIKAACYLGYHSDHCKDVRRPIDAKFYASKTSMLNIYAKCMNQKIPSIPGLEYGNKFMRMQNGRRVKLEEDDVICEDMLGIYTFFNEPTIFEALHVNPVLFEPCSDAVALKYTMFANASYWIYPILIKEKLRVWIYEGDVDCSVPITGTVRWITKLREEFGIPIMEPWREWWVQGLHKHEDQVGGMTWKLRGFTFASVRGAGHLVPKDKRKQAQTILESFLADTDLPYKSD